MTNTEPFAKYFTLEEAVKSLPSVKEALAIAHKQMDELRDSVILSKRLLLVKQGSGRVPSDAEVAVLQEKFEGFEEALTRWVDYFGQQGIILRDLDTGLIDFPYHSETTGQDYFLCWRLNEDGIFYFHSINEGFAGRYPITLLPE
ncbi:MAG: hypothetical protein K0Q50_873 [Vampirovibrio sp.]|jgi:hypothetical protein|nr:hypothetical protein [Vampirovibrio sp.]